MSQLDSVSVARELARLAVLALLPLVFVACSPGEESGAGSLEEDEAAPTAADDDEELAEGPVTLSEAAFRNAGIEIVEVREEPGIAASGALAVAGQVMFAPDRVALVSPRTSGRIERLTVVEGERVDAGQVVAYLLSPSFMTTQNDFAQAMRRSELLAGTDDAEGARALVSAARRRLQLLGASEDVISRLESGGDPLDLLPVQAPFSGSIVEGYALTGAAVEAGSPIFRIADLSVVDVIAHVPEQALRHLAIGQIATVRLAAFPERSFTGRIERLREELDPETRTVGAVLHVPNPDRVLRPGMFAEVILQVPVGVQDDGAAGALTIPASSVVTDGGERYVFVEIAPRTFERRPIQTAAMADGSRLVVLSGLVPGERVVARGAFTLKSELGKAEFGEEGD